MKTEKTAIQKFNELREQQDKARAVASAASHALLEMQRQPTEGLEFEGVEAHFERMKSAMQRSRDAALNLDRITQALEVAQDEAHAETLANFHARQPELEDEKNAAFLGFREAVDALVVAEAAYAAAHEAARGNVVEYRSYCHTHGLPVDRSLQVNSLFHYESGVYKGLEPVLRNITGRQRQVNGSPMVAHLNGIFTSNPVPELEV